MAWNEPGGGNQKDPWGGGDQGPPDLDEAFKKLQEKLNGIFGGGRGGSGSSPSFSGNFFIVFALLIAIIWAGFGIYRVDAQELAVVLRFGKFQETVGPGLHWNPPLIDSVSKINVTKIRTSTHRALMLTEDENIVEVSLSVQYNVSDPKNFLLEVRDPERSLSHATESALRHVVGSSEMHQVLTEGREQIAILIKERVQQYLDHYGTGIQLQQVNVEDTQPPEPVQAAFDDVIRAREDEERSKNEAETYKNGIVPEARGQAQRQLEEAQAYKQQVIAKAEGEAMRFEKLLAEYQKAPQVTRERLYIDTMQTVIGNSSKVMIDVKGGNNLLYLPLDKIIKTSETASPFSQQNISDTNVRQLTDRVVQQLRRDNQTRRREVR